MVTKMKTKKVVQPKARYERGYRDCSMYRFTDGEHYGLANGIVITRNYIPNYGWVYGMLYTGEDGEQWTEHKFEVELEAWDDDRPEATDEEANEKYEAMRRFKALPRERRRALLYG